MSDRLDTLGLLALSTLCAISLISVFGIIITSSTEASISLEEYRFNVDRRVTFSSVTTGETTLIIEGRCYFDPSSSYMSVHCKVGDKSFRRHYVGLSSGITYFTEQLKPKGIDVYHYRVFPKPQTIE